MMKDEQGEPTEWQGFVTESKSYLGYESRTFFERIVFWYRFPKAWLKFTSANLRYGRFHYPTWKGRGGQTWDNTVTTQILSGPDHS
jgi:hypothetical protein